MNEMKECVGFTHFRNSRIADVVVRWEEVRSHLYKFNSYKTEQRALLWYSTSAFMNSRFKSGKTTSEKGQTKHNMACSFGDLGSFDSQASRTTGLNPTFATSFAGCSISLSSIFSLPSWPLTIDCNPLIPYLSLEHIPRLLFFYCPYAQYDCCVLVAFNFLSSCLQLKKVR